MCGKNEDVEHDGPKSVGSPPRVREERGRFPMRKVRRGITPACAGRTRSGRQHDRSRQGSPPRVREELKQAVDAQRKKGITPACAGRTILHLNLLTFTEDHPRVCGKNAESVRFGLERRGSPPRVREEPLVTLFHLSNSRITPACAGRTKRLSVSRYR